MRILQLHSDFVEYRLVRKEVAIAEECEDVGRRIEDLVVLFTCVEVGDDEDVAKRALDEVASSLKEINVNRVLIYPYAHLSSDLARPSEALKLIRMMEGYAKELGIEAYRAPFGWNKAFIIQVKGHPLAEQLKVVSPRVGEGVVMRKEVGDRFHRFIIIDVDGRSYELSRKDWRGCDVFRREGGRYELLKVFVRNELEGRVVKEGRPKHIDYMRKLELIDYCPESDVGHMKWFPNGVLMKDLMLDYALRRIALPWGAMKIQSPLIYRADVEEIKMLQGEFHERDYMLEEDGRPLVLRFASDPGVFPFIRKASFSYKDMPIKVYEEAICFRKEQKGELTGLMRVRNFWMTDQHAFCLNEEQALKQYEELSLLFSRLMDEVIAKDHWVLGFEIVEGFYERYEGFLKKIVEKVRVPAFFKLMKEMTHYYAFKNEFQAIFPDGSNLQISTVQWDVKNGERFQICYIDQDGNKRPVPYIIHASSFGSIERALAAILESAAWMAKEGKLPMLPLWLSPEQVRIIPVSSEKHLNKCRELSDKLEGENIRVGLDDRNLTVSKKVFEAKSGWVPYIIVVGDEELKSDEVPVVVREGSRIDKELRRRMKLEEFIKEVKGKQRDMPFRPLYIPRELSRRAIFSSRKERKKLHNPPAKHITKYSPSIPISGFSI